ncbi:C-type mannose receptor 2-like [Macrobrachium nipponense]|uniref:C-type mannose receptor 2-like n=1 Tax=Macrobrachium nipponense TaxID=159736 RepID=UPI0030C8C3A4
MWLWHVRAFISVVVIASALPQPTDDSWTEEGMEEDPPLAVGGRAVTCPGAFQVVGDQCLYFAIIFQTDRNGAKQICDSFQGKLVAIREATAMRKIYVYIRNKGYTTRGFWIDGSRDTHGNWNFSDKTPLPMETPFWGASETFSLPKNGTGLNCAAITPDSGFYITNVDCSNTSLSPICEVAPISEGLADENTDADEDFATEIDSIDVTCPPFFVTIPGTSICTAFVTWANVSWGDARQICQGLHGDLFTINDAERFRSLYEYLQAEGINNFSFWIGGMRESNVSWVWHDGVPISQGPPFWGLSDTDDHVLEPDGQVDEEEDCVALTSEGKYYFRDKKCSEEYSPMCVAMPIGQ